MKVFFRTSFVFFLAALLLWYVLRDVPFPLLRSQFRQARLPALVPVALVLLLNYVVRTLRWQLALGGLGYGVSFGQAFAALMAGNLASLVVPGAGELTRCGALQRNGGVPLAQGVGSVVAERAVDLAMTGLLVAAAVGLEAQRLGAYATAAVLPRLLALASSPWVAGALLLVGLGVWLWRPARASAGRWGPLTRFLAGVGQGLRSLRAVRRPGRYVAFTVLIFVLALLATYLVFFTSPLFAGLGPGVALSILAISSLGGLAVPTQGGIGTYHALVRVVLVQYELSETTASVMATYLHAVLVGFILGWTVLGFLYAGWRLGRATP